MSEELIAKTGTWQVDDSLWSDNHNQASVDQRSSDPWYTERDDDIIDQEINKLSDADFSNFSTKQCNSLLGDGPHLIKSNHTCDTNLKDKCKYFTDTKDEPLDSTFETDHTYLNKLESKLDRLYKTSGRAERKSMVKQMSDRANAFFTLDTDRLDSSTPGVQVTANPITKHLFPHQQAITLDEKLRLVKHDQLSTQLAELINSENTSSNCETSSSNLETTSSNLETDSTNLETALTEVDNQETADSTEVQELRDAQC